MLVPLDAEVAWLPPEGEKPYWRGHITEISYELARERVRQRVPFDTEDG